MKQKIFYIIFFIIFILYFNILKSNENKILVLVDSEPITSYELKNKILTQLILSNQDIDQEKINGAKNPAINFLINLKIKKNEISKKKIEIDDANFNQTLRRISNNDILSLKKKFEDNSIDYELFLEEIKIELSWQKLIYSLFRDNVKIDENVVQNEINRIKENERETIEFRLFEIELDIKIEEDEKLKLVFDDIENIGFEAAAKKHSISNTAINSGDLGWINSNLLSSQINKILSELEINEVSKPIEKLGNILILKIKDKRKIKFKNDDIKLLKKQIIDQKTNELFKLYSNNHLSKIKNSSFIRFK